MAVTIRTQPIDGETWRQATTTDPIEALGATSGCKDVKLTDNSFKTDRVAFTPSPNGLVDAAIEAWNTHHHLVLRPDDFWLAIISQLGFYINANAEDLRHLFVSHKDKKKLTVKQYVHPDAADYATFAQQMAGEIGNNVVDSDLVPWIIPDFSTTTDTDRVVGSILLMGAMQKYFDYDFCCATCGIPSVTLLGSRADWVDLQARIDKIPRLGGEAVEFHRLLAPVARHMVLTFDSPRSPAVLAFWRSIVSRERPRYGESGGPAVLVSGWITSLCYWRADGSRNKFHASETDSCYSVDGVVYPPLDPKDKVGGWAPVPVKVVWEDCGVVVETRKCRMVAGSVGMEPGRHAAFGVRLDGLPLPPLEGGVEKEEEKGGPFSFWNNPNKPETPAQRRKRFVRMLAEIEPGVPAASEGLDAVKPRTGWWMIEDSRKIRDEMAGGRKPWVAPPSTQRLNLTLRWPTDVGKHAGT
jgi:hypothetical protein